MGASHPRLSALLTLTALFSLSSSYANVRAGPQLGDIVESPEPEEPPADHGKSVYDPEIYTKYQGMQFDDVVPPQEEEDDTSPKAPLMPSYPWRGGGHEPMPLNDLDTEQPEEPEPEEYIVGFRNCEEIMPLAKSNEFDEDDVTEEKLEESGSTSEEEEDDDDGSESPNGTNAGPADADHAGGGVAAASAVVSALSPNRFQRRSRRHPRALHDVLLGHRRSGGGKDERDTQVSDGDSSSSVRTHDENHSQYSRFSTHDRPYEQTARHALHQKGDQIRSYERIDDNRQGYFGERYMPSMLDGDEDDTALDGNGPRRLNAETCNMCVPCCTFFAEREAEQAAAARTRFEDECSRDDAEKDFVSAECRTCHVRRRLPRYGVTLTCYECSHQQADRTCRVGPRNADDQQYRVSAKFFVTTTSNDTKVTDTQHPDVVKRWPQVFFSQNLPENKLPQAHLIAQGVMTPQDARYYEEGEDEEDDDEGEETDEEHERVMQQTPEAGEEKPPSEVATT